MIKEQYTQDNFLNMKAGTVVVDYALSSTWEVLSNDGKEVVLKNIPSNPSLKDKGVTMTLSEGTFINTFCLLEEKDCETEEDRDGRQ